MTDEKTEIDRIEHELDILRKRQAMYEKWWGPRLSIFIAVAAALILITLAVGVWQETQDSLYGLFVIVVGAAFGAFCWLAGKAYAGFGPVLPLYRIRRVNIVRSIRRPAGLVPLYKSYAHPFSERIEIDEMIVWREKRLAELKGALK